MRKKKKLTIRELARKFNVAESTVSMWENGARNPEMTTLIKLAEFFRCSVDFLVGKSDNPNPKRLKRMQKKECPFDKEHSDKLNEAEKLLTELTYEELKSAVNYLNFLKSTGK
ncbi:MAG: helix-turn-helix transcriptional regulator [Oscillospiraceae bacterium]|nr:helix-turn-helix transcriptional regulator [Oscillospiraceae bacterium]